MTTITDTARALHEANETAEVLHHHLHQRQRDLLAFESLVELVCVGRGDTRTMIDQAEDIRRAVRAHRSADAQTLIASLDVIAGAILDLTEQGKRTPERTRTLVHMVATAGERARRVSLDLGDLAQALTPVAQAAAADPSLGFHARGDIALASRWLDDARREGFLLTEEIPLLERRFHKFTSPDQSHEGERKPADWPGRATPGHLFPPSINGRSGPASTPGR